MSDTQKVWHWRSDDYINNPEVFSEGPSGRAITSYIEEIGKWEVELFRNDNGGKDIAWQFDSYESAKMFVEKRLA